MPGTFVTRRAAATDPRHDRSTARRLLVATACVLALPWAVPARGVDSCLNAYFPVSPGLKLQYRTTYDVGEDPPSSFTQTYTNITPNAFTLHLEFADGGLDRPWTCTPNGLVSTEYLSLTAPQRRSQLQITSTGGVSLPPADQWKKGLAWEHSYVVRDRAPDAEHGETKGNLTIKYEVADIEPVTVPAGKFDAFKVYVIMKQDLSVAKGGQAYPMNNVIAALAWYAKDVGLVKATSETVATTELVSIARDAAATPAK